MGAGRSSLDRISGRTVVGLAGLGYFGGLPASEYINSTVMNIISCYICIQGSSYNGLILKLAKEKS